ncbi:MAG: type IV pilus assembly protein PilM [Patescibacteria group bacterium]
MFLIMLRAFNFLKQKISPSYLGVDIGTTSIKVVEVMRGDKLPRLVNYGILESQGSLARANTAFQTSTLKLFEEEVEGLLRALIGRMKPKTNLAIASLPIFSAFTTVLSLPDMNPADLEKAVAFQAAQYVPLPLSEVALDWSRVGEYENEKGQKNVQVLLVSVPHEQIKKYQDICKAAGLVLQSLEIEPVSATRILIGSDPTPTYVIDIGSRSTAITITDKGTIKFTSQTDFAGSSLTQALATSLNINPLRAEELKKERGIIGTGPNYELSTIMVPFLDAIISEVKRTDFSYHSQFPIAPKVERAILTGAGSNLLGIQKYFQDQLGVPVVKANPFVKFEYPRELEPLVPELNPVLTVALGLALREISK